MNNISQDGTDVNNLSPEDATTSLAFFTNLQKELLAQQQPDQLETEQGTEDPTEAPQSPETAPEQAQEEEPQEVAPKEKEASREPKSDEIDVLGEFMSGVDKRMGDMEKQVTSKIDGLTKTIRDALKN